MTDRGHVWWRVGARRIEPVEESCQARRGQRRGQIRDGTALGEGESPTEMRCLIIHPGDSGNGLGASVDTTEFSSGFVAQRGDLLVVSVEVSLHCRSRTRGVHRDVVGGVDVAHRDCSHRLAAGHVECEQSAVVQRECAVDRVEGVELVQGLCEPRIGIGNKTAEYVVLQLFL